MNNKEKRVTLTTEYGDIEIKTTSPDDKIKLILTVNKNSNHFQVDEKISITYPSFTSFFDIVSNLDFDIANAIDKLKKDKDIDECIKFDLVTLEDLKEQPNLVRSSLIESGRVIVALKNKARITLCRPALCFEEKNEEFKKSRLELEKKYWINQKEDPRNTGISEVADFMLKEFWENASHQSR